MQILNDLRDIGPFDFDEVDLHAIRWAIESDDFVAKFYPDFTIDLEDTDSASFCLAVFQLLERRVAKWNADVIQAARSVSVNPSAKYLRTADGQELLLEAPHWFGAANSSIDEVPNDGEIPIEQPEIPSDTEAYWAYASLND